MAPEFMIYVPVRQVAEFRARTVDINGFRILGVLPKREIVSVERSRGRVAGVKNEERVKLSGEKLRELRKLQGLTQRQLATQAGVSPPYVSSLEYEKLKLGSDPNIAADIASVLGIPLERLIYKGEERE